MFDVQFVRMRVEDFVQVVVKLTRDSNTRGDKKNGVFNSDTSL